MAFPGIGNVEALICEFKQRVKDVLTREWLTPNTPVLDRICIPY